MTAVERRQARIDTEYRDLRAIDADLFRQCVQAAEGIVINHERALSDLSEADRLRLGADIEQAIVSIALRASV